MKRLICGLLLLSGLFVGSIAIGYEEFPYGDEGNGDADIGRIVVEENTGRGNMLERTFENMGFGFGSARPNGAIDYLKIVVNYFISIVGFIATIVIIYGFYTMFTKDSFDEGYKTAREYIIKAFWGLLIMGLSWLIVSWIFGILQNQTGGYIN